MVGVSIRKQRGIGGCTTGTLLVTLTFQVREHAELHVEHVLQRPNGTTVLQIVLIIIATVGRQLQGYLVLVVVRLVVRTQTHKDSQLAVLQVRDVVHQVVGMYEHLQTLVVT